MTSRNEITGDMIVSKASNQDAYATNYDKIFRKGKSNIIPMMIPESTDPCVYHNGEFTNVCVKMGAVHCIWCVDESCEGCTSAG